MNNTDRLSHSEHSRLTLDKLRMKQSVRTTFKLSKETISLLGLIAGQLGIKQKSLLDQLAEDTALLNALAVEAEKEREDDKNRHPKTFVISRNTLQSINEVAKRRKISRDSLVEFSIKRLEPVMETERAKHAARKKLFAAMQEYLTQGKQLRRHAARNLGQNDEMYVMIDRQVKAAEKNVEKVQSIIEKGTPMEEW